jgi:hypothetical protein
MIHPSETCFSQRYKKITMDRLEQEKRNVRRAGLITAETK